MSKTRGKTLKKTEPEYIRNFASESGKKIPIGRCPRIGLSRVKSKPTGAGLSQDEATIGSPANIPRYGTNATTTPRGFMSPHLVRMGLPRPRKTPGSLEGQFISPVLTPVTPDMRNNIAESIAIEKKTPARSASSRKKVKKNLQEDFDEDIDPSPVDSIKEVQGINHQTKVSTRATNLDVIEEPVEKSKEILNVDQNKVAVIEKQQDVVVKKGKQVTKKTKKVEKKPKEPILTSKRIRKRKILSSSEDDNDDEDDDDFQPLANLKKARKPNVKTKSTEVSSSQDDYPLSRIANRIEEPSREQPKLLLAVTPQKVPPSSRAQETSPDCPILSPQVPRLKAKKPSPKNIKPPATDVKPKLVMRKSLSLKKRSSASLTSQQDLSDDEMLDLATTKHKNMRRVISSSSEVSQSSSVRPCAVHLERNPSGLSALQSLGLSQSDDITQESLSQLNIELVLNEVQSLLKLVNEKKDKLDTLKQAAVNKEKHKVDDLDRLTKVWEDGCKSALLQLHQKLTEQEQQVSMDVLMTKLGVPDGLFKFDSFEYRFV